MSKSLYIAEKPSVAQEFAKALGLDMKRHDGYQESEEAIVTWCVGHLVTMSYPEAYDEKYKKWSLSTLPFLPEEFKYEVIGSAAKQYRIVAGLLNRSDVSCIYVCTDSGREGEYIYRLVEQMAGVKGKERRRVWIDSQTEEEILRGIREAKDLSEYDNLSASAYLRAKEDYLMGINFSRLLSLRYGNAVANYLNERYVVISVGRVMTCVLGMVVRREREIRAFVKTPFYRVLGSLSLEGANIDGEWKAVEGSEYFQSPKLYKENGFKEKADAEGLIDTLSRIEPQMATVVSVEKKKETKNAPLLFNLAELQNICSKFFKISPDQTLQIIQELYEKKLVTYPRTDARVLSTAVAKEIHKNIGGLKNIPGVRAFAEEILQTGSYKNIAKTRYTNDKQITDHYAVIPTGQGMGALKSLSELSMKVYEVIVRRFLAIFYPPAVYQKVNLVTQIGQEQFFAGFKVLKDPGYLKVMEYSFFKNKKNGSGSTAQNSDASDTSEGEDGTQSDAVDGEQEISDAHLLELVSSLKKGVQIPVTGYTIKEGETSPPKRYTSGSMVLAMENAGQLIEDEELRAQIKGSGIGTSATRAEIIAKLVKNK
ncbi:MAG: DNA topoisomerase, partial [bacterium]|nr:DNA topoisomerase [bacterium]MDY4099501.1 DNA topoisomerase [Lachnospiraceae bacterium]